MKPLKDLLGQIRREIATALQEGSGLPHPAISLTPDRVAITLRIALREDPEEAGRVQLLAEVSGSRKRPAPATDAGTLKLEFRVTDDAHGAARNGGPLRSVTGKPAPLDPASADALAAQLATVIGPPGFDSSARATVLREVLEGLTGPQIERILLTLDGKPGGPKDPEIQRPRHRLSGILRTGPLRSVSRGAEILREVFSSHDSTALLSLLLERWKSQDDWSGLPGDQ